ncbi:MAG: potassium channel family protein [Bacteroidota bacterium]
MRKFKIPPKLREGQYNYLWVLIALINMLLSPIYVAFFPAFDRLIISINFSLIIVASIQICSIRRHHLVVGAILGVASLISIWLQMTVEWSSQIRTIRAVIVIFFFIYMTKNTFKWLLINSAISLNIIFAAVVGFLLLGYVGGLLFELLDIYLPGSLVGNSIRLENYYHYAYFSFVTLTSLGYGDIVPTNEAAQSLSLFIGIVGQFYFTIIIAILVGKYLSTN